MWLPLAVVLAWLALLLLPEATVRVPSKNDSALHLLMAHAASAQLAAGGNPLDFWIPQFELGFAQFQYYQHLPHLLLALLHRATGGSVSIETLFHGSQYVLLVLFPLVVAWSMRRMGFAASAAAFGGAAACLLSANGRYGLELESSVWRGIGLYSQLWGATLTCIALAGLVVVLRDGRAHLSTALALSALALSHAVSAFMLVITAALLVIAAAPRSEWITRALRLAVVGTLGVVGAAYFIIPFVATSSQYLNSLPGRVDPPHDAAGVIEAVISGRVFDADRWPVLTLLAAVGAIVAVLRGGPSRRFAVAGGTLWLLLYTVRPGASWLPSHEGFVAFRFILPLGLFALLLIGVAGEAISGGLQHAISRAMPQRGERAAPASSPIPALVASLVLLLVLAPALVERTHFLRGNAQVIRETEAVRDSSSALAGLLDYVQTLDGRFFAGPVPGWGDALRVGPHVRIVDYLHGRHLPAIGYPLQGLALNAGLLYAFRDFDAAWYRVYDVRNVITPADATVPPFYSLRTSHGPYRLWSVPTRGPAYFVGVDERRSAADQRALYEGNAAWLTAGGPATGTVIRWDYGAPAGPPAPRLPCPDGIVDSLTRTSQSLTLRASCPHDGALALSIPYHPQWEARVDGRVVAPYMISPALMAVDVPAGAHTVSLRYVPNRLKLALLALAVVTFGVAAWQRTRLDAPVRWWMARTTSAPPDRGRTA